MKYETSAIYEELSFTLKGTFQCIVPRNNIYSTKKKKRKKYGTRNKKKKRNKERINEDIPFPRVFVRK